VAACGQQAPQAPAAAPTAAPAAAAPTTAPAAPPTSAPAAAAPTAAAAAPTTAPAAPTAAAAEPTTAPTAAPTAASAAAGGDTIQIAWAGPLTGDIAQQGQGYLNGIQMAFDEWNAKGGVLGKQLVLKPEDDQCEPKQAGTVAVKIADDPKNVMLLGHFCSGAMLAGGPAYARVNLPVITLTTNRAITQQGWKNLFRPFPRDIVQGPAAVEFPMRKFGAKKFALINDKSAVAVGITDVAAEFLQSRGGTVTSTNGVEAKDVDYSAVLTKIIQVEAPDVILYCANSNTSNGLATKQMRALGYKGLIAGCDGYLDPGYLKSAEDAAWKKSDTEAVYFPFQVPPYKGPDAPKAVAEFGEKYKAKFNTEPFNVEVFGYDVGNIVANTLTTAGSTDHQKVIDTLHNLGTKGVLIPEYKFDANGDVTGAPMFIYTVDDKGQFQMVEPWRAPE
jgi:branched-chain amino acid transport system substrate-binding protein